MRRRHGSIAPAGDGLTTSEPPGWYHAALVEYEAHRAEVIAEAAAQQQTLTIGGTAAGIVFAGGLNVWHDQLLAAAALMGGVPLICLLVVVQWSARTIGLMRVGAYLERIELILRTYLEPSPPDPIFTWERTLVDRQPSSWWTPHAGWNDGGGAAVFIPLAFRGDRAGRVSRVRRTCAPRRDPRRGRGARRLCTVRVLPLLRKSCPCQCEKGVSA
jgi:hypothetical protein